MLWFKKKKPEFVAAKCPECHGNLELDTNMETAFCSNCGAQCIIENLQRKRKKETPLEQILDFVERRDALHRQDKQEKKREKERKEKEEAEKMKFYLPILLGFLAFVFIFLGIMASIN